MGDDEGVNIPLRDLHSPTEQYYRSIFDKADLDGDGHITLCELNEMIQRNGLTEEPLPQTVIRKIHQLSDINHDGQLDYREFVDMINNPNLKYVFGRYVTKYVNFVIPRRKLGATDIQRDGTLYEDEYTCCPPRLGMIIISVIELIFFVIDECKEENSTKFASGPMAQIFIYDPSKRYEIWRFFTYMFVHIGVLHLTVNLVVQIFIGIPLEMVHGWWRVLLIYFAGVVTGSLGTSITDPTVKLAGASGGVYSLITAHIATIIMNWNEMSFPGVQLIMFMVITGFDVGTSIYNRYYANIEEHIGYVAHFGGAVAGLLVGISILKNLQVTWKENIVWWIAAIVYGVLILICICWNIFYGDYFPPTI